MNLSVSWAWSDLTAWSMLLGVSRYNASLTVWMFYWSVRVSW